MSILNKLRRTGGQSVFLKKVEDIVNRMEFFLTPGEKILDYGAGTCMFSKVFTDRGYKVTSVDVRAYSYYSDIQPIIYDGKTLPFPDKSFDTCILMAVLHHTQDPEAVLREAIRVSKKLIILEDVISSPLQKYYTYIIDSIMNKEFFGHPHTNKDDTAWKNIFSKYKLTLHKSEFMNTYGYLLNGIYYLSADVSA